MRKKINQRTKSPNTLNVAQGLGSVFLASARCSPKIEHNSLLKTRMDFALQKLEERSLIGKDQRIGFFILDLATSEVLASHNHDRLFQSGSMSKMFIALAAFNTWSPEKGSLNPESPDFELIRKMLVKSDNNAANSLILKLGGARKLTQYLKANFADFAEVDFKELIPNNGASYGNLATPRSYCELLRRLAQKSFRFSDDFLSLLNINRRTRLSGNRTNYVVPEEVSIWHKTGSTSRCCGEVGLVSPSGQINSPGSYILSVIIDRNTPAFHYDGWISAVAPAIGAIAGIAYEFQRDKFGFEKGFRELSDHPCLK